MVQREPWVVFPLPLGDLESVCACCYPLPENSLASALIRRTFDFLDSLSSHLTVVVSPAFDRELRG